MTRRILIIHSPTAGKRRTALLDGVVAALRARGLAPEVVTTEGPGHATDLALSADADLVVAAGGDGTINEVVHGLMTRDGPRPAFATLPLGTINVLALELGLPRYAGDKVVPPDARLTAHDLHVLIGLRHGRWNLMRYGAAYMRGVLPSLPDLRIVPVHRLGIAAPAGKPVQLDGDNRLTTPVDIEVVDEPLMVASVSPMNG